MLKRKKAFKILVFLLTILGGIMLPNFVFNAVEDYENMNYVIFIEGEDVETNKSYIRILYNIYEGRDIVFYENSDITYINNNVTSYNLLGWDQTLYCVNAIINGNNIIISDIYYYDEFLPHVNNIYYSEGYINGYNNGINENNDIQYNEGYNNGYNEGYNVGSSNGYNNGYNEGLTIGYNNGYMEGQTSSEDNFSLLSLLSLILMYPFKVIALGMDVNIFGVNVGGLIIGLLAIGLVIGLISIFRGGKNE